MEKRKVVDGLVSIIMPSWNTERFIAETIQSVIDQTYQNWELIIVDDCSTDNTDEVVASFKDDRIKYFHNEKNSGAALTRNRAIERYGCAKETDRLFLKPLLTTRMKVMH